MWRRGSRMIALPINSASRFPLRTSSLIPDRSKTAASNSFRLPESRTAFVATIRIVFGENLLASRTSSATASIASEITRFGKIGFRTLSPFPMRVSSDFRKTESSLPSEVSRVTRSLIVLLPMSITAIGASIKLTDDCSGKVLVKLSDRKVFSGAERSVSIDFPMDGDFSAAAKKFIFQVVNQFIHGGELLGSRMSHFKVSDEADADSGLVDAVVAHVASLELFEPAVADFDFAVSGVDSISDDKMVGKTVRHSHLITMKAVVAFGVPVVHSAVVNDDVLPISADRKVARLADDIVDVAAARGSVSAGNHEFLAWKNTIARELVGFLDRSDRGFVALRNLAESVSRFDRINLSRRWSRFDNQFLTDDKVVSLKTVQCTQIADRNSRLVGNTCQCIPFS